MTEPTPAPPALHPVRWLNNQPYLLLSLTSLFWAGNIVLARHVAGHVPPMSLSCVRWIGSFLILLPFAWPHLKHDWPALRARLPLMVLLSATGFAINNSLSYWALQYTQALNALLIQSSGPLFVALWSLLLFGMRLTRRQLAGITISLAGVLTIILRGDFTALTAVQFNKGDLMFAGAIFAFGLYSALMLRRPVTHPLSLISFTTGRRAAVVSVLGLGILDRLHAQIRLAVDGDAGLCRDLSFDAGVPLLQPRYCVNRPEPRRAVLSSDTGVRLGDGDRTARRTVEIISSGRLCAGAGRRRDRLAQGLGEGVRSKIAALWRLPLSSRAG
jgi:drug/metabolite transporter (DMT)-like permease